MRIISGRAAARRVRELAGRSSQFAKVEPQVKRIVDDVRKRGDRALRKYAERWDGLGSRQPVRVEQSEIDEAVKSAAPQLRSALKDAAENIRGFALRQKPKEWRDTRDGISVGQIVRPLDSVGCYVPGGRYPLVSTLLMTVIPAQVAGVENIRVVSPQPRPEVLAAAAMLGVTEFYRIGGAQAVAALAYGTESLKRVDKIVGPGNLYVTAAKKLVSFDCAIDFLAGPTEVVILSREGKPEFIAADLVAQAEHDPETLAVLITTSLELAKAALARTTELARNNPIAKESLRLRGVILVPQSRAQSIEWANALASEHITVSREDLPFIQNAGSVFVGDYSAQAAGDYASGPNHVLPTAGVARFRGGLSVMDFVKIITVQEVSKQGLRRLGPTIEYLAEAEGLQAHANSIRERTRHA
ncbi:MAG: histidinol dehydrogenase [Acidobacteriaceae bacterium]|nr:histidinol dehydrogenase [Acidobacteriaceae bacterium]